MVSKKIRNDIDVCEDSTKVLSSPNAILWGHVKCLEEIIQNIKVMRGKSSEKNYVALSLHLSVLIVETFLNVFCGTVDNDKYKRQFKNRKVVSLHCKIKDWPKLFFGKPLDLKSGIGKSFIEMKTLRNSIMHYRYTCESLSVGKMQIDGLTDISFYENLSYENAVDYFNVMVGIIVVLLRLYGVKDNDMKGNIQRWLGLIDYGDGYHYE